MGNESRGFYGKYVVYRVDGSNDPGKKHENCKHFVIDIDHDVYAVPALLAYADLCDDNYPVLANDLREICLAKEGKPEQDEPLASFFHPVIYQIHQSLY